ASGDAPRQDAAAEERALERSLAVDAATAEARGFAHGVEPRDVLAVGLEHAAGEIGADAAEALAREDELADGDERPRLGIEDLLVLRGADLVAAVLAEIGDPAELLVVVIGRPALDLRVVRLDVFLEACAVDSEAEEAPLVHLGDELVEV